MSTVPGRDRRAVRHPGPAGRPADRAQHTVAVIGGGIAGLTAATCLAERGVQVVLLEREATLGGRVRAWPVQVGDETVTMSRGFHAFFRQYYTLRALLRRADPGLARLRPVPDYPLLSADGHRDSFAGVPRRRLLNLIAFVLRTDTITLSDLRRMDVRAATELLTVDFPDTFDTYDNESAAHFLDRMRFPDAARHLALEVFARSFFADPAQFSAAELLAMFHSYFVGSSEGLLFDVPDDDYDTALWAPLDRYLAVTGVDVRTDTAVDAVRLDGERVVVDTAAGPVVADAAVLAADPATTRRLLAGDSAAPLAADPWSERLAAQRIAPPFAVWRAWLDRPAAADRPMFLGTSGYDETDNISLVDRFEDGAAGWARRHHGAVVELHAYALADGADEDAVRARMRGVLDRVYPELAGARVLGEQWLVRQDCPFVAVGHWADRPGVTTPDPRLVLAGDGVRCALPVALMERAAVTGTQAANALLAGWGVAGHDVWSVPLRTYRPLLALRRLQRNAG